MVVARPMRAESRRCHLAAYGTSIISRCWCSCCEMPSSLWAAPHRQATCVGGTRGGVEQPAGVPGCVRADARGTSICLGNACSPFWYGKV